MKIKYNNKEDNSMVDKNQEGSAIEAQKIFEMILKRKGIADYGYNDESLKDFEPAIKLSFFNSNDAFLPSWMLRSDEISVMMSGKRLWDVLYRGNASAMMGYTTTPIKHGMEIPDSYKKYDVATSDDIPFALKVLMCQLALQQRLVLKDRKFNVQNDVGFYLAGNGTVEDGETIEFPDVDYSLAYEWNKISFDFNKQYKVIKPELENTKEIEEFSVELSE
ncbi:hypothetical protein F0M16_10455 [Vibrio cholerae]|uniref:Uncharacterized protein n=1 Tax=Vibrio cholerae TaxID=666 RepID=A0A5Q6PJ51_VIBCL|nr:hypothetical protein [Vibrio cholerae]KAA1254679.1 hypothetical protein F0M16_10455 [Vibrio cholerae]